MPTRNLVAKTSRNGAKIALLHDPETSEFTTLTPGTAIAAPGANVARHA